MRDAGKDIGARKIVVDMLPKTMSDSLVKKLNKACWDFKSLCGMECDDLGWCEACWIAVSCDKIEEGEVLRHPKAAGLPKSPGDA